MISSTKPTTEFASIEIGSIFNLYIIAILIIDNFPVLAFDFIINLLIIVPINILIFSFALLRNSLKITECVANTILMERLSLG